MGEQYIRLEKAPRLVFSHPSCSTCAVDCFSDHDGDWACPLCGTSWGHGDWDLEGTLYEDWAGEELPGPTYTNAEAWNYSLFGKYKEGDPRRK